MYRQLSVLLFLFSFFVPAAQDSIVFIIRVDDIQSRNTTTLPRSINDFQNAVEARGGKVTWAVIPHRLIESQNYNGVLSKELRNSVSRGHEISMHGYNHICKRCAASGHEMFCTTYNTPFSLTEQQAVIDSGLKVLRDTLQVVPKSFVPPAHVADTTTWMALASRNFPWLSTTGVRKQFIYPAVYNLPPHNEFTWQITPSQFASKLNAALAEIKTNGVGDGYYCLLLHDPFIRAGYENGLVVNWIGALLDSVNVYFGSRVKYMTVSEAAAYFRDGSTTKIDERIDISNGIHLEQNYPNPFKPNTRIKYFIPMSNHQQSELKVVLKVYDLLGREIAVLVDEKKQPGEYEAEFSAAGLPSGVYIYTLTAGSFVETRKMILVR